MKLKEISWKIIHLSEAVERDYIIQNLKEQLGAEHFEAVKGSKVREKYNELQHPLGGNKVTDGMFGCAESFYQIFIQINKELDLNSSQNEYIGIVEDDCSLKVSNKTIEEWISSLLETWDICFLGVSEPVEYTTINKNILEVRRFWGTHGMIIKRSCIPLLLKTYESYLLSKKLPLADWWISSTIKEHKLKAYCPNPYNSFCHQEEGFISYVTGSTRNNTKHLKEAPKRDK